MGASAREHPRLGSGPRVTPGPNGPMLLGDSRGIVSSTGEIRLTAFLDLDIPNQTG